MSDWVAHPTAEEWRRRAEQLDRADADLLARMTAEAGAPEWSPLTPQMSPVAWENLTRERMDEAERRVARSRHRQQWSKEYWHTWQTAENARRLRRRGRVA